MTDAKAISRLEERRAEVGGASLRYFVGGSGTPLVLVHGLAGAASNWAELAPLLLRRHRVLIVELPGHGGSDPLPAAPTLDPYADCVVELARLEGLLPAPLVGHSLGGTVALRAAGRHPRDVTAVVLLAAAGISSAVTTPRRARSRSRCSGGPAARSRRFADVDRRDTLGPLARLRPLAGRRSARALGRRDGGVPRRAGASRRRPAGRRRPRGRGRALRPRPRSAVPCLCVWGANDRIVPLADGFEYARRLGAPLRVIAGCGHLLIGERPAACADAIESFLMSYDG